MKKSIIVFGGTSGIGREICDNLSESYYRVYAVGREFNENCIHHSNIHFIKCDVTNIDDIFQLRIAILNKLDSAERIYGIVYSSGIAHATPFENIAPLEWDEIFNVNVKGAFFCTQLLYDLINDVPIHSTLPDVANGKIIFISSISGYQGFSGHAHYCASKFAVQGLMQVLAKEMVKYGILVNTVNPGPTDTPMWEQLDREYTAMNHWSENEPTEKKYFSKVLIKRMGKPRDVANTVRFLLDSNTDYITGASIPVCGGNILR